MADFAVNRVHVVKAALHAGETRLKTDKPHLRNVYNLRSGKIYSLVYPENERKHR